ncbi:MAG: ZIP family metal transporter [Pseudomonadota bacterium]
MNAQTIKDQLQANVSRILATLHDHPAFKILNGKYKALTPFFQRLVQAGALVLTLFLLLGLLYAFFDKIVVIGFVASILAGLATGLGALPALLFKTVPIRVFNTMLGAAAGVMLAATAFSLIVPGIQSGNLLWPGKGIYVVAIGMMIGALFLDFADRKLPRIHFMTQDEKKTQSLRKIWLFIIAITIHNFPEGMAVGVSFGTGDMRNGVTLAIAIGLQNIPEGLAVALPLVGLGYTRQKAVLIGLATGLVEPVGGLLGVTAVTLFQPILPIAMGFAAGAMLFVISEEIIPETHSNGKSRVATFGVMIGFIVMMILDNLLG